MSIIEDPKIITVKVNTCCVYPCGSKEFIESVVAIARQSGFYAVSMKDFQLFICDKLGIEEGESTIWGPFNTEKFIDRLRQFQRGFWWRAIVAFCQTHKMRHVIVDNVPEKDHVSAGDWNIHIFKPENGYHSGANPTFEHEIQYLHVDKIVADVNIGIAIEMLIDQPKPQPVLKLANVQKSDKSIPDDDESDSIFYFGDDSDDCHHKKCRLH